MLSSLDSIDGTRRRRLIVAVGAVVLLLATLATYSLLVRRPEAAAPPSNVTSSRTPSNPDPVEPTQATTLTPLSTTSDPEQFVRDVAEALFSWDTNTLTTPTDLTERLVAVADPTGESSAGLVADIANYLPTPAAWTGLQHYETRQRISVSSTEVPSLWPTAVQQAGTDGLLPGTTAYTIRGVRQRAGVWEGTPVTSAHDVAFTVFVVCGPSYPECHLLRLSRLNKPLD